MNVNTPIPSNGGDWVKKFGTLWASQIELVRKEFDTAIEEVRMPESHRTDVPILIVKPERLIEVLRFLKVECHYIFLSDLTATDEYPETKRFELIYNLFSLDRHVRIRVKTKLEEGQTAPSAIALWPGANWAEREVFDMFGVVFAEHPDLRRILNDSRFVGHPLRKDYSIKKYQIFLETEKPNPKLLE